MSFKVENVTVKEAVVKSNITTDFRYANIAFCNATIATLPVYCSLHNDSGGNIPGGANSTTSSNGYLTVPFNQFLGSRKHFSFDGTGYFYTTEPGYYKVTVNMNAQCTDSDGNTLHDVDFVMMNQSGGNNNKN